MRGGGSVVEGQAYPVPHCSIFVMLSWRRPLSHPSSSCLLALASLASTSSLAIGCARRLSPVVYVYLDSPILAAVELCALLSNLARELQRSRCLDL